MKSQFDLAALRAQMGVTQVELAKNLGVCQANVSFYETKGQTITPHVAKRLIQFARKRKVKLTYEQIYGQTKA